MKSEEVEKKERELTSESSGNRTVCKYTRLQYLLIKARNNNNTSREIIIKSNKSIENTYAGVTFMQ